MRKGLISTNDQKPTGQGEPQKLNIITSAIIPNAVPQPEPKGTDLSRMITTHDEPKVSTFDAKKIIDNLVIDIHKNEPIDMGAEKTAGRGTGKTDGESVTAPANKKTGGPKK